MPDFPWRQLVRRRQRLLLGLLLCCVEPGRLHNTEGIGPLSQQQDTSSRTLILRRTEMMRGLLSRTYESSTTLACVLVGRTLVVSAPRLEQCSLPSSSSSRSLGRGCVVFSAAPGQMPCT